jgi:hypothetical protein
MKFNLYSNLNDGVMETRLLKGKSLVGFDSLPLKGISLASVF